MSKINSDLASNHVWKAKIAASLAGVLGVASFVVSFVMASIIFSETRTIWNELDSEISEFESISNNIWKDVANLSPLQRTYRQVETGPEGGVALGVDTSRGGVRAILRSWAFAPSIDRRPAILPNFADLGIRQSVAIEPGAAFVAGNAVGYQEACSCDAAGRKCPPGPDGPPGPPGDSGLNGVPGVDGKPGFDMGGSPGSAGDGKCQVCPDGPPGADGGPGQAGPKGMRGADGHPGMSAGDGQPGPPGGPGSSGATGLIGPPGAKGPPGKPIEQIRGVKGAKGPPGPIGIIGDKGLTGSNGLRGSTGPNGAIGEPGPQGPQGENGDPGRQGDHGDAASDGKYCPCPARRKSQSSNYDGLEGAAQDAGSIPASAVLAIPAALPAPAPVVLAVSSTPESEIQTTTASEGFGPIINGPLESPNFATAPPIEHTSAPTQSTTILATPANATTNSSVVLDDHPINDDRVWYKHK